MHHWQRYTSQVLKLQVCFYHLKPLIHKGNTEMLINYWLTVNLHIKLKHCYKTKCTSSTCFLAITWRLSSLFDYWFDISLQSVTAINCRYGIIKMHNAHAIWMNCQILFVKLLPYRKLTCVTQLILQYHCKCLQIVIWTFPHFIANNKRPVWNLTHYIQVTQDMHDASLSISGFHSTCSGKVAIVSYCCHSYMKVGWCSRSRSWWTMKADVGRLALCLPLKLFDPPPSNLGRAAPRQKYSSLYR